MLAGTSAQHGLGFVEPYQQLLKYSCGAAALKAVLKHWGDDYHERPLISLIGVDPTSGSTVFQVTEAARKLGFDAKPWQFDSLDELQTYTANDVPVIIAIQSFTKPDQGHFVVAVSVDDDEVQIMDPNVKGNWRTLSRAEMDQRWRFRDRSAVVVTPKNGVRRKQSLGLVDPPSFNWVPVLIAGGAAVAVAIGVIVYRRRTA